MKRLSLTMVYSRADRCIHVNDHGQSRGGVSRWEEAAGLGVVVTVAKGYDLGYIWKTQGEAAGRTMGGYYISAAQAGEPPGRWWGPGAQALGLTLGQIVQREPYDAVDQQIDPRTGARLGRARGRYATSAEHLARLQAAEPHATAERLMELEREAAQATRQPAVYIDVTVLFSKSISVLHASLRENERRAGLAGDQQGAAYWAGREQMFQEILHRANRAALEYLQAWAGVTRTGYHGARVFLMEPGRFEPAGLIVTSWMQGTSRDGDPQDHVHNQIARITRTFRDGKWRALDTMSVRGVLGALQAIAATAVECELTAEFGVAWVRRGRRARQRDRRCHRGAHGCGFHVGQCRCMRRNASWRKRGRPGTGARRPRASCCTSPMMLRCGRAGARTPARWTGMRWPRGGTPRSAVSWPASRPRCRTRAARAHRQASITAAGRLPGRRRGRPRRGRWQGAGPGLGQAAGLDAA